MVVVGGFEEVLRNQRMVAGVVVLVKVVGWPVGFLCGCGLVMFGVWGGRVWFAGLLERVSGGK